MRCSSCQEKIDDHAVVCIYCGKAVNHNLKNQEGRYTSIPVPKKKVTTDYNPISVWGYVGYSILFGIPFVGFISLVVFAFDKNINLRNYARSQLVLYAISFFLILFKLFMALM